MWEVLLKVLTGLFAGFITGIVSYSVYKRQEEAHVLLERLIYRPLGIPEDEKRFKRRLYIYFGGFVGLLYGIFFESLRIANILQRLQSPIQNLTFFGYTVGFSIVIFQAMLQWKVPKVTKKMAEQWLMIGFVFGILLGILFNLVSFFIVGPLLL